MESRIIEKKIKFEDREWLVKVNNKGLNYNELDVFVLNENNEWVSPCRDNKYVLSNMSLMKMCKKAILESSSIRYSVDEYEELMKWDGNMDKELNCGYDNINEFYKSLANELEEITKINIKKTYNDLQETAKKIIKNCELEKERLEKCISITEIVKGDELI